MYQEINGVVQSKVQTNLFKPRNERFAVARFVGWMNSIGPIRQTPSFKLQTQFFEQVKQVAWNVDGSLEMGNPAGYDRRVLYEEPETWSLAAIILRPGQHTHEHDHGGWGCAVTVQGIERDCRFMPDETGKLLLISEQDYPAGTGYTFNPADVHQPVGIHPSQVTVALHFLIHG